MIVFGARVRFVTDAGKPPEVSPIGRCGTWMPHHPLARRGQVRLDRPMLFLGGRELTHVLAHINDLEEL